MTDFIENTTGVCPFEKGTMVQVQYDDGLYSHPVPALLTEQEIRRDYPMVNYNMGFAYDWSLSESGYGDIIRYRLVEEILTTKTFITDKEKIKYVVEQEIRGFCDMLGCVDSPPAIDYEATTMGVKVRIIAELV